MDRLSLVNLFALAAGWIAVAYFWQGFYGLGIVPAQGAHIFVPAFILGAMLGITLMSAQAALSERLTSRTEA